MDEIDAASSTAASAAIDITPMRREDLDDVLRIERAAYQRPWARDVFEQEIDRLWAFVDVLRPRVEGGRQEPGGRHGRVVAFVNYWLVRDEVHVLNVATHPEERRRGYAARLMEHVLAFARERSCRYVTLEVRRSNVGAMRLYRRFAFRPVGVRPNYYAEDHEDAIVMLLELDGEGAA